METPALTNKLSVLDCVPKINRKGERNCCFSGCSDCVRVQRIAPQQTTPTDRDQCVSIEYIKSTLSINTHLGCDIGCTYCILTSIGLEKRPKLIHTPEQAFEHMFTSRLFVPDQTPITMNNRSDPLHPDVKPSTFALLELFAKRGLRNPVQIISKLNYKDEDELRWVDSLNVKIYQTITYSALSEQFEPLGHDHQIRQMQLYANVRPKHIKLVHYWRPIIEGFNDSEESLRDTMKLVSTYCDLSVVSGVRLDRSVIERLNRQNGTTYEFEEQHAIDKFLPKDTMSMIGQLRDKIAPDYLLLRHSSCFFSIDSGRSDYLTNYHKKSNCQYGCPNESTCAEARLPDEQQVAAALKRLQLDRGFEIDARQRAVKINGTLQQQEVAALSFQLGVKIQPAALSLCPSENNILA